MSCLCPVTNNQCDKDICYQTGMCAESGAYPTRKEEMKKETERAVLVTTAHRGVFFGYAKDTNGPTINLTRARMCVYWSADLRGIVGLAAKGPSDSCRISSSADMQLRDVTSVIEVSPEAVEKWEKAPWA